MLQPRHLLNSLITYSAAKEREDNILHQLGYFDQRGAFFARLNENTAWMKWVVAHHLNLRSPDQCHVAAMEEWINGSFNVCIPIQIDHWSHRQQPGYQVMLRFPLPYRVGEHFRPGNSDEKIQCEAGTYSWLQENCPGIPIPQLYGFAVSTGETFTQYKQLPVITRCLHALRRHLLSFLGLEVPSLYTPHSSPVPTPVGAGYLLIEYIEESQGSMLSKTWLDNQSNSRLRANFFRSFSQILLNLSRIPLPRIASFIIDTKGYLRLNNRPLSMEIQMLENEAIPTNISRSYTYSTVEAYTGDLLGIHDSRFQNQPNAVNDISDGSIQMATLAAMRTILPVSFSRELHRGPFVFSLTDLHQSNIFVDSNWNITCLVDLEWGCSRPIEMIELPYWLTGKGVDEIDAEEYDKPRGELMKILASEEMKLYPTRVETMPRLSEVLERTWTTGTFWVTLGLSSPSALFTIFSRHICPGFYNGKYFWDGSLPFFWTKGGPEFIAHKVKDKQSYDRDLQLAFQ